MEASEQNTSSLSTIVTGQSNGILFVSILFKIQNKI